MAAKPSWPRSRHARKGPFLAIAWHSRYFTRTWPEKDRIAGTLSAASNRTKMKTACQAYTPSSAGLGNHGKDIGEKPATAATTSVASTRNRIGNVAAATGRKRRLLPCGKTDRP